MKYIIQDRERLQALVNMVIRLCVPKKVGNFLNTEETISFSRRTLLHGVGSYGHGYVEQVCVVTTSKPQPAAGFMHCDGDKSSGLFWQYDITFQQFC
jgi:isopentenyl phosphate kinase